MSFASDLGLSSIPPSLREPGPGRCIGCGGFVERYRTAGNQNDPGHPLLAAFEHDPLGSWRLALDAVMHRRPTTGVMSSAGWRVHRCPEEHS